ncbi:MAG: GxxExxY protein [Planctomycetaceae bacterium]|nr:GxxExxY protein [Planctomycetaceae bacterium]
MESTVNNDYPASAITGEIIGAAMEVHNRLGPGFLESVYEEAMAVELSVKKIRFERQKELPVFYRDKNIKTFICDLLVEKQVIVELKAIKALSEIEQVQLTSYLKASKIEVGLLINFGGRSLTFKRMIFSNENQ